tara:strand:+ start:4267 stop:4668 length:402 start_codon:yes stop_codon:yes gene_type:complete
MRNINEIVLHCADTKITQSFSIKDIRKWHVEERGWSDVGYHYYIRLNGNIERGRPVEKSGAHAKGHNSNSIGVCFEGGKLSNGDKWVTPLLPQMIGYKKLKDYLFAVYGELKVSAHYEYSSKSCPNFDIDILK